MTQLAARAVRPGEAARPSPRPRRWWPVGLLLGLLAFSHAALYAALVPPWQAPDEPAQVEYVLLVAQRGRPTEDLDPGIQRRIVEDLVARDFFRFAGGQRPPADDLSFEAVWPGQARYAGRQPAYFLAAALIVRLFPEAPIAFQVSLLRAFSAFLFGLTVAAIFATARLIFPERPLLAVGAALAAALLPMAAALGGAVNNDNLANLVGAATFLGIALVERRGYRPEWVLALIGLAVVALYTKRTTLILIPLVGLVLALAIWRQGWRARVAAATIAFFALVAAVAAIETFPPLRNAVAYTADRYFANASVESNLAAIEGISPAWQNLLRSFVLYSGLFFQSSIGLFGWVDVALLPVWYLLAGFALLSALLGAVLFAIRTFPTMDAPGRAALRWLLVGLLFSVGLVFIYALYFSQDGTAPQGRYLFVSLSPLLIVLTAGLAELFPRRARRLAAIGGAWLLLLFDAVVIVGTLLPEYYG
ncbi:MAG: hypothetical protein RMM58_02650 [Chloroflexota bacterium]|nr:hypothetical protein [Dehalococcoidia bacterium]MDW8252756.1 hypothetical protein [Chloroflexota bacterium]